MASNNAFTNQGAVTVSPTGGVSFGNSSNPISSALNKFQVTPTLSQYGGIAKTGISSNSTTPYYSGPVGVPSSGQTQSPLQIHQGLLPTLTQQGGSHTTTDAAGNTSTTKINPPPENLSSTNPNVGMQTAGLTGNTQGGIGQATTQLNDIPTGPNYNLGLNPIMYPSGTQVDQYGTVTQAGINGGLIGAIQSATPSSTTQTPSDVTSTPSTSDTTFSGLLSGITGAGANTQAEQNATADQIAQLRQNLQTDTGIIQAAPQELNFQTGRVNALQTQEAAKESALQGQLQAEISAGTQNIGALTSAAGLAQPQLAGFNQQQFNPITGQFGTGAGGTTGTALSQLPPAGQTAVQTYAQQIQNGQMTRADAENRLSAYGIAGTNALTEALGSNFNTNASNASASTTATGQQLQTQATAANQALDTLSQQFSQLGSLTGATGFQPLNSIEQSIGSMFGNSAVSQYQTTLQEARAKISGVLAASGGVTPTTADEMARTYLPDGMTPSQLPAKIAAAKTLIQQSVSAFTQSGQQNQQSSTSSSGLYNF